MSLEWTSPNIYRSYTNRSNHDELQEMQWRAIHDPAVIAGCELASAGHAPGLEPRPRGPAVRLSPERPDGRELRVYTNVESNAARFCAP